jgi:hypothetical protein
VKPFASLLFTSAMLCLFAQFVAATPAVAITADLANKCRQMAIKAHPPQRAGAKSGSAEIERKYYRDCLANGGVAPDGNTQNPPVAPAR